MFHVNFHVDCSFLFESLLFDKRRLHQCYHGLGCCRALCRHLIAAANALAVLIPSVSLGLGYCVHPLSCVFDLRVSALAQLGAAGMQTFNAGALDCPLHASPIGVFLQSW